MVLGLGSRQVNMVEQLMEQPWYLLDSCTRATKPMRGSWGANWRREVGGGEAVHTHKHIISLDIMRVFKSSLIT